MRGQRIVSEGGGDEIAAPVADYLAWARSRKYSEQTLRQYDYALRTFAVHLAACAVPRFQDVTRQTVEDYHRRLLDNGLSLGSRENLMRAVRKFFRWLETTGKVFADPTADVRMPKRTPGLLLVPTEEEMRKLLAQPDVTKPIGIRDRTLMEVAYGCGLRRSELAGLTIFDPDVQQGTLRVLGKGQKERVVPLGRQAVRWLRQYLKDGRPKLVKDRLDEEALWIAQTRGRLDGAAIRQQVRGYVQQAGIRTPMNLHSLRKACATHMLRNGAHPVQIQMLLGHANLSHLSQYLSVTITDMKKTHSRSKPGG